MGRGAKCPCVGSAGDDGLEEAGRVYAVDAGYTHNIKCRNLGSL